MKKITVFKFLLLLISVSIFVILFNLFVTNLFLQKEDYNIIWNATSIALILGFVHLTRFIVRENDNVYFIYKKFNNKSLSNSSFKDLVADFKLYNLIYIFKINKLIVCRDVENNNFIIFFNNQRGNISVFIKPRLLHLVGLKSNANCSWIKAKQFLDSI